MLASEGKELQEKSQKTLSTIRDCLEDNKAFDIIEIDLKGKTEEADFMLIATGSSKTQISAISQKVMIKLKKEKVLSKIEGIDNCDWVLIDALDVIVNIFKPEVREFYMIEKIWSENLIVDNKKILGR